jgi:hypothetical protein
MNPVTDWPRTPAPRATLPVRDGSRNSSAHSSAPEIGDATATAPQQCPVCAAPLPSPRARYCSAACRQRAFRLRHPSTPSANDQAARRVTDLAHLTRELQRQRVRVAHTVHTPSMNVHGARRGWSASAAARSVTSSAARWAWVATAPTATSPSCWPTRFPLARCLERRRLPHQYAPKHALRYSLSGHRVA